MGPVYYVLDLGRYGDAVNFSAMLVIGLISIWIAKRITRGRGAGEGVPNM